MKFLTCCYFFIKQRKPFFELSFVARHVTEADYKEDPKWLRKANAYLQLSDKYTNLIRENT